MYIYKLNPFSFFFTAIPLLLLCLLFAIEGKAQVPNHNQQFEPDSIRLLGKNTDSIPKRFGRSALGLGLAETVVWGFDRYITKVDWAYIDFETIRHNLSLSNWQWDDDPFTTNQIGHPFHGSIFYNSFRSNGYNFWQSMPSAFVGSYLWETFAERQAPAPNDFINTSFGGIILGEVTHRLAEKVHNSTKRGFSKKAAEVFVSLINPMDGLNRLLDGKWGTGPGIGNKKDLPPLKIGFEFGARRYNVNNYNVVQKGKAGLFGRIILNYGKPGVAYKTPFSEFSIVAELGQDDSTILNGVSVQGSVTGWKLDMLNTTHLAMVSANYDYIRNEAFYYSAHGIRMNLYSAFDLSSRIKLNTYFGLGPIILAAVPNIYKDYAGRNYDYGPGFAFNAGGNFNFNNRIFFNTRYRGGWTSTVNGGQSSYYLSGLTNELGMNFNKIWVGSIESGYFGLIGYYKDHDDIHRKYPYLRLTMKYNLSL